MSYSIYLRGVKCQACGRNAEEPDCPGPTYNLTGIFDLALTGEPLPNPETPEIAVVLFGKATDRPRGLRALSGRIASETIVDLDRAVARLVDPALYNDFVALEPDNGWGTLPDALNVMQRLQALAAEYPNHVWEIH
jgi:hypothetical protein